MQSQATKKQTIEAAQLPDALLRLETVIQATGLSTATIYRKVASGQFPKPSRIAGSRAVRWPAASVRSWIQSQTGA